MRFSLDNAVGHSDLQKIPEDELLKIAEKIKKLGIQTLVSA